MSFALGVAGARPEETGAVKQGVAGLRIFRPPFGAGALAFADGICGCASWTRQPRTRAERGERPGLDEAQEAGCRCGRQSVCSRAKNADE
mmetsp:Transcript_109362/g.163538  ORF Transcript_109362/g.163538 Transcript_109362/m.163538 type:complete len:90 (+) Transcript_109362:70-339(+)